MKTVKYRKCKICRKKVFKNKDLLAVMIHKDKKKRGFYHLSCNNYNIFVR